MREWKPLEICSTHSAFDHPAEVGRTALAWMLCNSSVVDARTHPGTRPYVNYNTITSRATCSMRLYDGDVTPGAKAM
jgi:hypothetical protein